MRIASWNINGVRRRQGRLIDWLRAQRPDLVALQKVNAQERDFPFDAFRRAGYHAEVHGSPSRPQGSYGVAILSRRKPRILQKGLRGQEGLGPRLLTVEADGLEFSSVYAPYKMTCSTGTKIEWFETLIEQLKTTRLESERRVLCGDFNVVPEYRFGLRGRLNTDNYDPGVQARFGAMLKEAGLFDLYDAPPRGWGDRFTYEGPEGCVKCSRVEYVLGTQGVRALNPDVWFDIGHAIVRNPPHYWVRAPIVADLDD